MVQTFKTTCFLNKVTLVIYTRTFNINLHDYQLNIYYSSVHFKL